MIATIAVALLIVAGAETSNPDVACIVDRVPAETRARIPAEVAGGSPGPIRAALSEAASACARERSWSAEQSAFLEWHAAGIMMLAETGTIIERAGIRPSLVDDWFDDLPRDVQINIDLDDRTIEQLLDHLVGEGVAPSVIEVNMLSIGHYLGSRIVMARVREGLGPP